MRDHLTEIPHYCWVVAIQHASAVCKHFDRGRLDVVLQYRIWAIFFSSPLKFQWRNVPTCVISPGMDANAWNFGSDWPGWSENTAFQSIFGRSASAVHIASDNSSMNTNRKSTMRFPMSLRWTSAKYRLPVTFSQNWPTQQSPGLFVTAKLLVFFYSFYG